MQGELDRQAGVLGRVSANAYPAMNVKKKRKSPPLGSASFPWKCIIICVMQLTPFNSINNSVKKPLTASFKGRHAAIPQDVPDACKRIRTRFCGKRKGMKKQNNIRFFPEFSPSETFFCSFHGEDSTDWDGWYPNAPSHVMFSEPF